MEFVDELGGFLIGSFAVLMIFVAIPIVIIGALTYLVPRDRTVEEVHSEPANTRRT